jgi:hypothetical protein
MDPFPPSRAEASAGRASTARGSARRSCLPARSAGSAGVDKFFYSLTANNIETQRLGLWWATGC